jgi:hypothetical protein
LPAPPITIGELTDVPTYDSAIASPWAQEVSRRIVHRFASTAERDSKYPAAGAGVGAMCEVGSVLYICDGGKWADLAQRSALAVALESRYLSVKTVASNADWSITNDPMIDSGAMHPPPWSNRALIRTDLIGIYLAAGAAPQQADFQLSLNGGAPKGRAVTVGWSTAQLRTSVSWTTYVDTIVDGNFVMIHGNIPGGITIRFDQFSTANFDITWLPPAAP